MRREKKENSLNYRVCFHYIIFFFEFNEREVAIIFQLMHPVTVCLTYGSFFFENMARLSDIIVDDDSKWDYWNLLDAKSDEFEHFHSIKIYSLIWKIVSFFPLSLISSARRDLIKLPICCVLSRHKAADREANRVNCKKRSDTIICSGMWIYRSEIWTLTDDWVNVTNLWSAHVTPH